MTAGRVLRRIGDPVVAGAPTGVRIRTGSISRPPTALTAVGGLLGSAYRRELAGRVRLGRLDLKAHAVWRAQRKQALTAVSSSRWAGAITRAVEDQYQLGMRGLAAQVADLRAAVQVLQARCVLGPGELAPVEDPETRRRSRRRRRRRFRNAAERFTKTRRLAVLRSRLARAEKALAAGRPTITVGGKRLWRNRNHLEATDMTEPQWRDRWDSARMFLTADGESGKAGGNETIRVDEGGRLRIKVPAELVDQFGTHLVIAAPVQFNHRAADWWARVSARQAVRYDITYDPDPVAGISTHRGKRPPNPHLGSTFCGAGECWGWISMLTIWPPVCSTPRATRSVNPSPSPSTPPGSAPRGAMGGCARASPSCSTTPASRTARRSWWRTSTSPTRAPPAAKLSGAASVGNGCAAPSRASPPDGSAPA